MKKTTIRPDSCCEIQMVFLPPPSRLSVMASPTSRRPWLLTQSRRFWPSAARVELSDCILSLSIKLLYVVLAFGDSSGWLHPLEAAAGKWMDVCVESTVQCIFSVVERVFCSVLSPLWICACGVRGKEIYRIIKMQMQPQLSRAVEAVPFSLYLFIYFFAIWGHLHKQGHNSLRWKGHHGESQSFWERLRLSVLGCFYRSSMCSPACPTTFASSLQCDEEPSTWLFLAPTCSQLWLWLILVHLHWEG